MKSKPLPSRFSGPGSSPGFMLWRVSNAWQRRQRAALKPFGLTHSQFVLLAAATWFGGNEPLTQARLAEPTGVDPMTTSQVVRTLEAAGLLKRERHADDIRANALTVTAAGREKARKAIVAVEAADDEFFAPVAGDSKRLLDMFQTLLGASAVSEFGPPRARPSAPRAGRGNQSRHAARNTEEPGV